MNGQPSDYRIWLSRYACSVCGREWGVTRDRLIDEEYPDGIDHYGWTKCPDHPDAKGHRLCTFCGAWSRRCSVRGCQRDAESLRGHHYFAPDPQDDHWRLVAVCERHQAEQPREFWKHYSDAVTTTEAEEWAAAMIEMAP